MSLNPIKTWRLTITSLASQGTAPDSLHKLGADHTENTSSSSSYIVACWLVAMETYLSRCCQEGPHRKHRVLHCYVSIYCHGNVFTVPLPSNYRICSFQYSKICRHVTVSYRMATKNGVVNWILAADTMKLVMSKCTMLSGKSRAGPGTWFHHNLRRHLCGWKVLWVQPVQRSIHMKLLPTILYWFGRTIVNILYIILIKVKVKLSLCLIQHYATNMYERVEV